MYLLYPSSLETTACCPLQLNIPYHMPIKLHCWVGRTHLTEDILYCASTYVMTTLYLYYMYALSNAECAFLIQFVLPSLFVCCLDVFTLHCFMSCIMMEASCSAALVGCGMFFVTVLYQTFLVCPCKSDLTRLHTLPYTCLCEVPSGHYLQ